ncbi:MAG TPA: Rrf2 family transcriptional regulator [Thermohalobaculum sp.]|nr:Rrf2 family transcriptional regulator [Thermohalobaculum sp.]
MKLSTKGRYAVTALADIALNGPGRPVTLAEISERQDISLAYLEQLFVRLRRAGIVESVRGPGGGYLLARPPAELRISEVMAAVDERLNAMGCDGKWEEGQGCGRSKEACLTHNLWEQLSAHVHVFLSQTSIADVIGDKMTPCPAVPDFSALLEEEEARA